MTIQAWSLNVRDFTVPPRERQRQPSLGGLRPLGMAAVAAPSVGTVKSLTFRPHACIVPEQTDTNKPLTCKSYNLRQLMTILGKKPYDNFFPYLPAPRRGVQGGEQVTNFSYRGIDLAGRN